jgi:hypothetical protein
MASSATRYAVVSASPRWGLEVLWPGGTRRWLLLRAEIEAHGSGGVQSVGVAMDITARKHAELHLRLLVNELNHRAHLERSKLAGGRCSSTLQARFADEQGPTSRP